MASENLTCLGHAQNVETTLGVGSHNVVSAGSPFFPPTGAPLTHEHTIEVFFYTNDATAQDQNIVRCTTFSGIIPTMSLLWNSLGDNQLLTQIRALGADHSVHLFSGAGETLENQRWYHLVIRGSLVLQQMEFYIGRTSRLRDGTIDPVEDTFPYGGANGGDSSIFSPGASTFSYNLRPFHFGTNNATELHRAGFGSVITGTGDTDFTQRLVGGIAEFRLWDVYRSDGEIGAGRTGFIPEATPNVVHNFRFNETVTAAVHFDDLGPNNVSLQTLNGGAGTNNSGFNSSPFAAEVTVHDVDASNGLTLTSAATEDTTTPVLETNVLTFSQAVSVVISTTHFVLRPNLLTLTQEATRQVGFGRGSPTGLTFSQQVLATVFDGSDTFDVTPVTSLVVTSEATRQITIARSSPTTLTFTQQVLSDKTVTGASPTTLTITNAAVAVIASQTHNVAAATTLTLTSAGARSVTWQAAAPTTWSFTVLASAPAIGAWSSELLALITPPSHYWILGEDSGTTAADSGTDGDGPGTLVGATFGATGITTGETSMLADGVAERCETTDTTSWMTTSNTEAYTIGVWFEIDSFSTAGPQYVMAKVSFIEVRIEDDGNLEFARVNTGAAFVVADSGAGAISTGTKYFMVGTWDDFPGGVGQVLYLNGVPVGTNASAANQNTPVFQDFVVGRRSSSSGQVFDGRIQHPFIIEGTALSAAQVLALWQAEFPPTTYGSNAAGSVTFTNAATAQIEHFPECIMDEITDMLVEPVKGASVVAQLGIWNVTATALGVSQLTSVADSSRLGALLQSVWSDFRKQFLTEHPWAGAKTTQALTTFKDADNVTEVIPTGTRWTRAFLLPDSTDSRPYLHALYINGFPNSPNSLTLNQWEIEIVENDAGTLKRCLLTNSGTVNLEYIFDVGDAEIDLLSSLTQHAMGMVLAVYIAPNFGKNAAERSILRERAEDAILKAKGTDGQESTPSLFQNTSLLDARERF